MFKLRKISYLIFAFALFTTMPKAAKLNASINNQQLTNESFQNIENLGKQLVNALTVIQDTVSAIDFNSLSSNIPTSQIKTILFKHYSSCLDWNEIFTLKRANLSAEKIAKLGSFAAAEILSETFTLILNSKKMNSTIPNEMEKRFNKQIDLYICQIKAVIDSMKKNLNLSPDANEQAFINKFINGKTFNNIKNATTYDKLLKIKNELKIAIPEKIQELIDSAQKFYANTITIIAQI